MITSEDVKLIKDAINNAPIGSKTAEYHLQFIKYARKLTDVSSKELCELIGAKTSFHIEVNKMKKIVDRLVAAGLNIDKI